MFVILILLFDHFLGRGVLAPTGWSLSLASFAALAEFHLEGWVLFSAIMRLQEVRDTGKFSASQRTLAKATLLVGLAWDVTMNVLATFWLLQLPFQRSRGGGPADQSNAFIAFLFRRTWLLSSRLEQNVFHDGARWEWQRRFSERFRRELLDNIDPRGIHRG